MGQRAILDSMTTLPKEAAARVSRVFARAELGDPRRVRRAVGLAQALARNPERSLPQIWSTSAELEAGYRFLRSARTGFQELMDAVQQSAREAALECGRVLVLHDTTDVTCQSAEPDEVGFLATGKAGFYVHHALAVSGDGSNCPLGILWSQVWGRAQRSRGRSRNLSGPELAKQKERESDRWLEGVTEAALWSEGCEEVVHVMDREADSFRVFEHMQGLGADFVVRMRHDRRVSDGRLSEALVHAPVKLTREVSLSARRGKTTPRSTHKSRSGRSTKLLVRSARVQLQPPHHMRDSEPVTVNVVHAYEEEAPDPESAVSWVLATSLPVSSRADLERVLDIYRARWLIEEFHRALKTGCMFEKRQLESFESITTLLAISYPVACELLWLRSRARDEDLPASDVMRPSMLQCLRIHPKARPLSPSPTAHEALLVVAGLGGHQKHNGPPGWQSLAVGYRDLLAFERGFLAAAEHFAAAR